jgi:RNA polymerase sigma-70 factor (ECF subfamily)
MTEPSSMHLADNDDGLVTAARTDRESFGRLFDRFYPHVLRYALRRLLLRENAEDATSEVFLHVARGMPAFRGTTIEDFRRWLFRIATNEINARLRKSLRRRELLEAAARLGTVKAKGWADGDSNGTAVDWGRVYEALSELPEREQSLVSLRYFAGMDPAQIADVLRMKAGAVRTALSRALQRLRDRLLNTETSRPRPASIEGAAGCRENSDE